MRNNQQERRLMDRILRTKKQKCPHLKVDEYFSGDCGCKCEVTNDENPLGVHELLVCVDPDLHKRCVYYKKLEITWELMTEMTLKIAKILTEEYKIDGYQYNECVCMLRSALTDSLKFQGYTVTS